MINVWPSCFRNTRACTYSHSWFQISIYFLPNYSTTFFLSLVSLFFIAGSSFPYEDRLYSFTHTQTHTHSHTHTIFHHLHCFLLSPPLNLPSEFSSPLRISCFANIHKKHTLACMRTLTLTYTNGCCHFLPIVSSVPTLSLCLILPELFPEFFSPQRIRIHKTHTFMHRLTQKHELSLLMDWLPHFLSFIFPSLLFPPPAPLPRWGLTTSQPPQTLVTIMWYPCFVAQPLRKPSFRHHASGIITAC